MSRRRRGRQLLLDALGMLVAAGLAASPPPPPISPAAGLRLSAAAVARLAGGEVVERLEPAPAGGPRPALAAGTIDEPPARVFLALADFAHWSEFMPFLRRSEARGQADGSVLCTQSLALPMGERHYQVKAQATAPASAVGGVWRVRWSYVEGSGNIVAQRGSWTLTPYAGGRTLAVLSLASDPGGVRAWLADRVTEKSIPWIFNGLRQQVRRGRYAPAAAR